MLVQGILQYQSGPIYATWDPSKCGTSVTLSTPDYLTATMPASGSLDRMVLSTYGKTTDRWYWEITIAAGAIGLSVGISTASGSYNSALGVASSGWTYRRYDISNDDKFHSNSGAGYGSGALLQSGQVISFALDMVAGSVTVYKNGVTQGVMYNTGLLGNQIFAAVSKYSGGASSYTANFGASAFSASTLAIRTTLAGSGYNMGLFI